MKQWHPSGPALLTVNVGIKFHLQPNTFARTGCNMVAARAAVAEPRSQTCGLYARFATEHSSFVSHLSLGHS